MITLLFVLLVILVIFALVTNRITPLAAAVVLIALVVCWYFLGHGAGL